MALNLRRADSAIAAASARGSTFDFG